MARFIALPNLISSIFVLGYVAFIFHLVYRTNDILIGKLPETLQKCKLLELLMSAWVKMLFLVFQPDLSLVILRFGLHSKLKVSSFSILNQNLSWIFRYFGDCTWRSLHICHFRVLCRVSCYDCTGNIHNSRREAA